MSIRNKNIKKILWMTGFLTASTILGGCSSTPRGLQHVPAQPATVQDSVQTQEEQGFAATAGSLAVGATGLIQSTPVGVAQVTVRSIYTNALGESCKKLYLKGKDAEGVCGVCLGNDGVWRYVPSLQ